MTRSRPSVVDDDPTTASTDSAGDGFGGRTTTRLVGLTAVGERSDTGDTDLSPGQYGSQLGAGNE